MLEMDHQAFPNSGKPNVRSWNSKLSADPFAEFESYLRSAAIPHTASIPDIPFSGFSDRVSIGNDGLTRGVSTSCCFTRSSREISRSTAQGFIATYIVEGRLTVEQDDRQEVGQPGDVIIVNSLKPSSTLHEGNKLQKILTLSFDSAGFAAGICENMRFPNLVISRNKIPPPLSACLVQLWRQLPEAPHSELQALFHCCRELIPFLSGEGKADSLHRLEKGGLIANDIFQFLHHNISDPKLSARVAALSCNVSERYVHKIFAARGMTFGTYVTSLRLENMRTDLLSPVFRNVPISELAFRSGFNELSTFHRAFKRHFGCTPQRYRKLHAW